MIDHYYAELSYQEKLTMILTASFNEILKYVSSRVYARIILAERHEDKLLCYLWQNGSEVGTWEISLNGKIEYSEDEVLRKIEKNIASMPEDEDDMQIPMAHAKRLTKFIFQTSDKSIYIIPTACSKVCPEGLFFDELYQSFVVEWEYVLENTDDFRIFDYPDCYAAANASVDAYECVQNACARLLAQAGFLGGFGDPYESQRSVSVINELARIAYENRATGGTIVARISSSEKDEQIPLSVRFSETTSFEPDNIKTLRKYIEMTTESIALVILDEDAIGLADKSAFDWYIRFNGKGGWLLYKKEKIVLKYENGKFFFIDSSSVIDFMDEEKTATGDHEAIQKVIKIAREQKHGTCIIFSPGIRKEVDRLSAKNRCISIDGINLSEKPDFIIPLSSIDGAIMCDYNGVCFGIGAILDGEATIAGDKGRGARFNSAYNYIAWKKNKASSEEYIAAIISEDGYRDIFSTNTIELP